MPTESLAILKTGLDLAKAVKDFVHREKPDHRLNDRICTALRAIYFTPSGVVALLRAFEQNQLGLPTSLVDEDVRDRLINFNDREWEVGRALQALDFDELKQDLRLSLATIRTLEMIRWGKINLRRNIQDEVNYYGRRGVKPNLANIQSLIDAIEKLNAEIIEIEKLVNSRAYEECSTARFRR
jgi:hypothetical protein